MTDPKEFETLDQLFRKTFDDLPDTPAASGWDTPSGRVWQHVQSQIKPPRSGWSAQAITLLAAFAVTLAVGIYLYLGRANKVTTPATEVPVATEQPATPVSPKTETTENQTVVAEKNELPAKQARKKAVPEENRDAAPGIVPPSPGQAAKPDDGESATQQAAGISAKKPVSPNSTERRKAELARRAETAWKTPLAPLPPHWPKIKSKNSLR